MVNFEEDKTIGVPYQWSWTKIADALSVVVGRDPVPSERERPALEEAAQVLAMIGAVQGADAYHYELPYDPARFCRIAERQADFSRPGVAPAYAGRTSPANA